uniref:sulfatase-like hydrolase/transferase n=1 Tax=Limnohabitans sp. TaxID=1907725 RepID=UPI004047815B
MGYQSSNVLFILSDEHTRDVTGCYGHPFIKTPHLDKLAASGTRFDAAYTNCPICVPARASLHTGTYVAENRCWDNAHPYDGSIRSWAHRLRDAGHQTLSIGKLHFRSDKDDNGFVQELIPLHVVDGEGDLLGLVRIPLPAARGGTADLAATAGPGESTYANYDRNIRDAAVHWLINMASKLDEPWCLFVSFVKPHFPLIAPQQFYDMYPHDSIPMPRLYDPEHAPTHPVIAELKRCMNYDDNFSPDKVKIALAAYYGMVSFLDDNIGQVLDALQQSGMGENTRIIYSTDHGDNLGNRHLWGKSVHYEESAAIPMIIAGPGIPVGKVSTTPVTLVDVYPTIVQSVGLDLDVVEQALPGQSLVDLANNDDPERVAFGEYHAAGSITAMFMVRKGRWKYVHYEGYKPELFDLQDDPGETCDLAGDSQHALTLAMMEAELRKIVDPTAVNAQAFADQMAKIERFGGIDALTARGDFGYSPAPGEKPVFATTLEA